MKRLACLFRRAADRIDPPVANFGDGRLSVSWPCGACGRTIRSNETHACTNGPSTTLTIVNDGVVA